MSSWISGIRHSPNKIGAHQELMHYRSKTAALKTITHAAVSELYPYVERIN